MYRKILYIIVFILCLFSLSSCEHKSGRKRDLSEMGFIFDTGASDITISLKEALFFFTNNCYLCT
jgi:predicted small secreted protein